MGKLALFLLPVWLLGGCIPRIEVAAPKEPITINMNVNIEHEIHIKADKNVGALLNKQDKNTSSSGSVSSTR